MLGGICMKYKKIGNLILLARKELGMTQRQLADKMNISEKLTLVL